MNTLKVLKKARELISVPSRWTQGEYARDANGMSARVGSSAAVCFCSLGAIRRVGMNNELLGGHALQRVLPVGYELVSAFNDTRTHAEVLALFDKAIKAEEDKVC